MRCCPVQSVSLRRLDFGASDTNKKDGRMEKKIPEDSRAFVGMESLPSDNVTKATAVGAESNDTDTMIHVIDVTGRDNTTPMQGGQDEEEKKLEDIQLLQEVIQRIQEEVEEDRRKEVERIEQGNAFMQRIIENVGENMKEHVKDVIEAEKQVIQEKYKFLLENAQREMKNEMSDAVKAERERVISSPESGNENLKRELANDVFQKIKQIYESMNGKITKHDSEIQHLNTAVRGLVPEIEAMASHTREIDQLKSEMQELSQVVSNAMRTAFPRLLAMLPPPESEVRDDRQRESGCGAEAAAASGLCPSIPQASSPPPPPPPSGSSGSRPRCIDLEKALHEAVSHFRVDDVRDLLGRGARVNAVRNGRTVLHAAAQAGSSTELIHLLLDAGANPHWTDSLGRTPLHMAGAYGRAPAVAALVRRGGANVHARDHHSWTPLHWAARCPGAAPDCVRVLMTHGADAGAVDDDGRTPLDMARTEETLRVLRMRYTTATATSTTTTAATTTTADMH